MLEFDEPELEPESEPDEPLPESGLDPDPDESVPDEPLPDEPVPAEPVPDEPLPEPGSDPDPEPDPASGLGVWNGTTPTEDAASVVDEAGGGLPATPTVPEEGSPAGAPVT